jgi:nucleotide-binding universal stress UspA family protein
MRDVKKILVGVDGSDGSLLALRWALGEAKLRGDAVEVVHIWHVAYYGDITGMMTNTGAAMMETAEAVLASTLDAVAEDAKGVTVTSRTEAGTAATTLIGASEHADLLVVGRRGHGGFLTLVIGSVAQQVAAHAHCPVVIVAGD